MKSDEVESMAAGQTTLAVAHPNYDHVTVLPAETVDELLIDLGR